MAIDSSAHSGAVARGAWVSLHSAVMACTMVVHASGTQSAPIVKIVSDMLLCLLCLDRLASSMPLHVPPAWMMTKRMSGLQLPGPNRASISAREMGSDAKPLDTSSMQSCQISAACRGTAEFSMASTASTAGAPKKLVKVCSGLVVGAMGLKVSELGSPR